MWLSVNDAHSVLSFTHTFCYTSFRWRNFGVRSEIGCLQSRWELLNHPRPYYSFVMELLRQAVAKAHQDLEHRTQNYLEGQGLRVSCRKGCFSCCFALVVVGLAEAEYLREHIPREWLDSVEITGKARLERLAKVKSEESFATKYFLEANPCPLLSSDGACSAHAQRPLACRGVLTNLEAKYCAPGAVPSLKGKAKTEYQRQLRPYHGPEHYLKVPWHASEKTAQKLWETEQRLRGFTVIGELASQLYLLGQADFQAALAEGQDAVRRYLKQRRVLGGAWGFWVG